MAKTYAACLKCKRMNRVEVPSAKQPVCGACKADLPVHGAVVDATDSTLPELLSKSPLPIVLDIWAPWCGPCRAFAPTFEEYSARYAGKVVFVKLNSDENQQTSSRLGVRGIPTLVIFKDGAEKTRQSGALSGQQFGKWLEQFS